VSKCEWCEIETKTTDNRLDIKSKQIIKLCVSCLAIWSLTHCSEGYMDYLDYS